MRVALRPAATAALAFWIAAISGAPAGAPEMPELDVLYVPSHPKAVEAMLRLAGVTNTDYVVDLGCGDGRIIIAAAKTCGARGLGVDLDPERIRESRRNAAEAGVADRVEFRKADMAITDLRQATVVTLFLSAEVNLRLRPKLLAELKPGARVVSNGADMGDWKPDIVEENADAYDGMLFLWTIAAPVAGSVPVREAAWCDFVLPWDDGAAGPTDVRQVLPVPKALPRIEVRDGHLWAGKQRLRIYGVNITAGGAFPSHEQAEKGAARLAKFGVNGVRFHHLEPEWSKPNIFADSTTSTRVLSAESLDRLDYLISQLKRQGIYVDMNLLVSRRFRVGDGLPPEIEQVPWKQQGVIACFDPKMVELQKEYARNLLGHTNTYTGLRLADDPVLAVVEINNENGMIFASGGGSDGLDSIPEVFLGVLRRRWNEWLRGRFASSAELRKAWDTKSEPLGAEMLRNGDFGRGMAGWQFFTHAGATGQIAAVPTGGPSGSPAVEVSVPKAAAETWHVQFLQGGLAVKKGGVYTARCGLKADRACSVSVALTRSGPSYDAVGLQRRVDLTPDWQTWEETFPATADATDVRFIVDGMGAQVAVYRIAGASLRPGGEIGLRAHERLEAGTVPLVPRRGGRVWPAAARRDFLRFLWQTETDYWEGMRRFLREEVGVRAAVLGSQGNFSPQGTMVGMDVCDEHYYWQHPRFPNRPWDRKDWFIEDLSIVERTDNPLLKAAGQRVAGKPFFVTEYNHPAPLSYGSEASLAAAMMAGFQDWDGIWFFHYDTRQDWSGDAMDAYFGCSHDPAKMVQTAVASLMVRRGDIAPARELVAVAVNRERSIETIESRGWGARVEPKDLGIADEWAYVHRLTQQMTDADAPLPAKAAPEGPPFTTDTGEIVWSHSSKSARDGLWTLNAPRARALVGFASGKTVTLGDVGVEAGKTGTGWCAVAAVLTEGERFGGPCRILVTATARAANTNWKTRELGKGRITVDDNWGKGPTRVEIVPARLTLPAAADRVTAWALDARGQRGGKVKVEGRGPQCCSCVLDGQATLWYEIAVR